MIKSVGPLAAIFLATAGATCVNCTRLGWRAKSIYMGVLKALPFSLFLAYCMLPTVSETIFQSWSCIAYEFDARDTNNILYQSYLRNDLSVRCSEFGFSDPEHNAIRTAALILMAIWPVGMVALCTVTLLLCRRSLAAHVITPLNRATRFLHQDYKVEWFAWELLELNRRAILVGWVIFVFGTDQAFLRLVTALLLSVASLALLLSTYPYAQPCTRLCCFSALVATCPSYVCASDMREWRTIRSQRAAS